MVRQIYGVSENCGTPAFTVLSQEVFEVENARRANGGSGKKWQYRGTTVAGGKQAGAKT